eukprot:g9514.t1
MPPGFWIRKLHDQEGQAPHAVERIPAHLLQPLAPPAWFPRLLQFRRFICRTPRNSIASPAKKIADVADGSTEHAPTRPATPRHSFAERESKNTRGDARPDRAPSYVALSYTNRAGAARPRPSNPVKSAHPAQLSGAVGGMPTHGAARDFSESITRIIAAAAPNRSPVERFRFALDVIKKMRHGVCHHVRSPHMERFQIGGKHSRAGTTCVKRSAESPAGVIPGLEMAAYERRPRSAPVIGLG